MRRTATSLATVALALGLTTCRGCRQQGPASILDLAAADTLAAVIVPDLGALASGVDGFTRRATRRAGGAALTRMRTSLAQQVGFDIFDVGEYEELGLAKDGGCLVFTEGTDAEPLLAFTVWDRDKFDAMIKALIVKTDGAGRHTSRSAHGFTVTTASRPFGDELVPAYHWVHVGRFVLTARQEGKAALDAALARLAAKESGDAATSLRSDPLYTGLSAKVPAGTMSVYARTNAAGRLISSPATVTGGMMTRVAVGPEGFSLDTFMQLDVPGLAAALAAPPVKDLAGRVAPDAAVIALTRVAKPDGVRAVRSHPTAAELVDQAIAPLGRAIGVDPEKEVLPLLAGPLTLSVHLKDLSDLPNRLRRRRSLSTMLELVHVAVTAELSDPEGFRALLERSRAKLAERGVALRTRESNAAGSKATIWEPDRPNPKLGWAIAGTQYVYGAGAGRLDDTLALLGKGDSGLASALSGSVGGELAAEPNNSVIILRAGTIADAASAITLGKEGAGIGAAALVGTALELMRSLGDVAVAVSGEAGGLRLRVRERLQ
jgi:hypothetical protein